MHPLLGLKHADGSHQRQALHLRPSERVMEYLRTEFERPGLANGSRLPPIRELAMRLKVSPRTVQGVFKRLVQEGRIRTAMGNGTFLVPQPLSVPQELKIALSISLGDAPTLSSSWKHRICGGILDLASRASRPITLVPLPYEFEFKGRESQTEFLISECKNVHGLISFPNTIDRTVREIYDQHEKPIVSLNPFSPTCLTDFVAPDYFGASYEIGSAWKKTGRKHILLLLHEPLEVSVSNRLRLAGLVNGWGGEIGNAMKLRVQVVAPSRQNGSCSELRDLIFQNSWHPDAIYCTGDLIALDALNAVRKENLKVPSQLSIIGGSGIDLTGTACPQLTRTRQPLEELGRELMAMLCKRIQKPGESLPGKLIRTPFIGGKSTRSEENVLLGIETVGLAHSTAL